MTNVPLTIGSVLRLALAELAPWLAPSVAGDQWIDPGIVHPTGREAFARMSLSQIADQARQQGDTRSREVWVSVMPGRQVWLRSKAAPVEPRYRVAFDHRVQRWTESDEGMAAQVTVEYGTGSSGTLGTTGMNAGFGADRGFAPSVMVSAGNVGEAAATALRNVELGRRAVPAV